MQIVSLKLRFICFCVRSDWACVCVFVCVGRWPTCDSENFITDYKLDYAASIEKEIEPLKEEMEAVENGNMWARVLWFVLEGDRKCE